MLGSGTRSESHAVKFSPAAHRKTVDTFWNDMPACEHSVQLYDCESSFIDVLEGYVAAGIRGGDAIIVIATPEHRATLEQRLAEGGFDVQTAARRGQYIALDARATLERFVVDGWPDELRFRALIGDLVATAREHYPSVRAFGEMVGLLWQQGRHAATLELERLWTGLCHEERFALFCAYSQAIFADPAAAEPIRAAHARVCPL